ncbi:MAG TPA: alpha/beta hydrolase [Longimicrobiaceae bacterium]|nr:alpha/beta hydrolase [Longimicrobiaceae bacterium]
MSAGARAGETAVAWSHARWAEAGGARVRYREAGDGPPLVLVHGLGLSCDFWVRNGPPLAAAGFRVLAPDLPGFGPTPGPGVVPVAAQARAVAAWADALGLGPAAYLGHSVSCQAVLELAADEPARATGLVLAAPTGDPVRGRLLRQAAAFVLDAPREPLDLIPFLARDYLRAGPLRWLRTWVSAGRHDALAVAARVRCPGVVVIGKRDPVVRPAFARALAEALPRGRVAVAERGAHAVVFDAADDFNREVAAFLREVVNPPDRGAPPPPTPAAAP